MENSVEQRVCLKFCVLNEISCVEALKMVQKAYGDSSLSRIQAYEWYKSFIRSGRPSTSNTEENVAKIKKIVLEDRRMTEREIPRDLNISNGSIHHLLHDILGMRRVAARLVKKHLEFLQKEYQKNVCEEMIFEHGNDSTFMKRIITGDETWVYEYDVETSQQSSEWRFKNEPKPKKPRKSRSKIKVMLTVFFDYRGVVHYEFLLEGHTINKEYYLVVMRHLR
ncbi:protein GVQW3-like [Teleopsis dalmanni]|uniref:protein GVQW3-like n=1 Tax=Teleopsis dalmanni TaxID=139649 RepID=UPI0018CE6834|nr:protein GVQW3-like [Teleopsis dalmanni]